jgi:hypothetical protein
VISNIGFSIGDIAMLPQDSISRIKPADSLMNTMNAALAAGTKEIKITGVKALPDSMVSVYNNSGIKAVMRFDNNLALNYELAIPIKYLGLSVDYGIKFSYNVLLHEITAPGKTIYYHNNPSGIVSVSTVPRGLMDHSNSGFQNLIYPTDFWGEYTLAKK